MVPGSLPPSVSVLAATTMWQPSLASARHTCLPMPRLPPVTTATRSFKRIGCLHSWLETGHTTESARPEPLPLYLPYMPALPPGRCPRCYLRPEICLCPLVPRIETRSEFVILRHALENWKMTN